MPKQWSLFQSILLHQPGEFEFGAARNPQRHSAQICILTCSSLDYRETYVEVEPESEYWIRIQTDSEDLVRAEISVDGKSLGYYLPMNKTSPALDKGVWKFENGKSYDFALKFAKAKVREATNEDAADKPFWTGIVQVDFSEAIYAGEYEMRDQSDLWTGGDVSYVMGISDPDKKKGVKSEQGSSFNVQKTKRRRTKFAKGGLLKTITLRYCSTLGLIHAGILPKPPMWDLHRLSHPAENGNENVPQPNATVDGATSKQSEVFDLS